VITKLFKEDRNFDPKRFIDIKDNEYQLKYVDNVPFVLVSQKVWDRLAPGKPQPSQSYISLGKDAFALMVDTQFYNDKEYWISHEVAHCKIAYGLMQPIPNFLGLEEGYPNNADERATFTYQFKQMLKDGINKDQIMSIMKNAYSYNISNWYEYEEIFFKRLLDRI
jgi:hypothetical protein